MAATATMLQLGDVARQIGLVSAELAEPGGVRSALEGTLADFAKASSWEFVLAAVALILAAKQSDGGTGGPGFREFVTLAVDVQRGCLQNPAPDEPSDMRAMLAAVYGMATFWCAVQRADAVKRADA